jgi:hypothetical protein
LNRNGRRTHNEFRNNQLVRGSKWVQIIRVGIGPEECNFFLLGFWDMALEEMHG